jgi:hypothetical protein
MTRRFEVGPILVALGATLLLVSLFLDWSRPQIDQVWRKCVVPEDGDEDQRG